MKKTIIFLIIIFLIIIAALLFIFNKKETNGIPRIDIKLNKNITLEEINNNSKEIKYDNNKLIINNKKYNISIKGRGNSTWTMPKKPYQITFDKKTSLLNYKSEKYVLLANYLDPSLLKNDFTYSIAKKMNLNYSNTGEFIDLYVNKEYVGNYYLIPKIDINKASVDLKNKNAVLVELDNHYYKEEKYFTSKYFKDQITIKDKVGKSDEGINAFEDKYNLMEKNVQNKNYQWLKENIDINSFIQYYLISTFSKNPDIYRSSLYFYMDGINDQIHLGPIWDFDVAYDRLDKHPEDDNIPLPNDSVKPSILFDELLKIKEFKQDVKDYWNTTASKIYQEEITNLDDKIKYLQESGEKNSMFWNMDHYNKYTDSLKDWLNKRYNHFNELYK